MADYRELSTDPAVKPSGSAALATDAATVVTLSPNSVGSVRITDGTTVVKVTTNGEQYVSFVDLVPAAQSITAQDIVSVSTAGATGQSIITGTATAGSTATMTTSGDASFAVLITGTWTGTLQFERSLDAGTTYTAIGAFSAGTSFIVATTTLNGAFHGNASSSTTIRVRSTAAWTGTATVKLMAGSGAGTVTVGNPLRLFDRVSGVEHSIKAASTAAVATDTAFVVALSPTSPVQQAALVKGVQGTTGVSTQAVKDTGRVSVVITAYQAAGIITTEALFAAAAFSSTRDGGTPTTGQQFTVTTGKRFVIQSILVTEKNTAAAAGTSKLALRYSGAGGVISNTSPVLVVLDLGSNSTVASAYIGPATIALPDGCELIGGATFGFTNLSSAITMLNTVTLIGYEY